MADIEVRILGPLGVCIDGQAVELRGAKVRALLAVLVVNAGEVVSADALLEALWGERPPEGAIATLRTYVSQLRKALGAEVIRTHAPGYVLAVGPEQIDAGQFEALVGQGRFGEAVSLWQGPALGEFADAPFAQAEAARLEELRLVATEEQIEAELAQGHHDALVGRLRALVEAHPLRERLWGQLILALYRSRRQAEALRAYAQLRRRLGEELGIEPGPALRRLEADVLAQGPELDWRPPAAAAEAPTNLAPARSSFVGRTEELEEVGKLLAAPGLVTMVGPGGVGKTRLATEAGRRLRGSYRDGVWLVELAALSDPDLLPQAVATALGVREEPGRPLRATLAEALAPKTMLVVLDNCEHLVAAAAALADAVLTAAPDLAILATSREPLRVEGEVVWSTPSLPVPDRDDLAPEALVGIDAVRLFCERAAAQGPFALDAENASAVSALCRRLDGIPLAIELAAARSAALSPAHILERLDRRFRLLTAGRRTVPRHETLVAAVEWSHDLLSADERTLFRRLSVFRGFPLEAAEEVCSGDGLDRHQVAPLLADLVDRSLVVAQPLSDGGLRYSLLETLRTFSEERLVDSGEQEDLRRRHLGWVLALTEGLHASVGTVVAQAWRDRLDPEHDNVRQAMSFALSTSPEAALRIVGDAGLVWATRGYLTEGRGWATAALAAARGCPPDVQARALQRSGAMAQIQGDRAASRTLLAEALVALRAVGDKRMVADTLSGFLAPDAMVLGDMDGAEGMYQEALALSSEIGYQRGVAWSLGGLGLVARKRGDPRKASTLLEESVAGFRSIGYSRDLAQWQGNWAGVLAELGDEARACSLLEEAVTVQRELGDKRVLPYGLESLGQFALWDGDHARATALFEEALAIGRETGMRRHVGRGLRGLAVAALRLGDIRLAGDRLAEALTLLRDGGDEEVAQYLEAAAALAAMARHAEMSVQLFGAADAVRTKTTDPLMPGELADRDRELDRARAVLDEASFVSAWARGAAIPAEEAMSLALDEARSTAVER